MRKLIPWLLVVVLLGGMSEARATNEPRLVRLHSPCEEDEVLQPVHMRRYRKDVYECEHPDNLR